MITPLQHQKPVDDGQPVAGAAFHQEVRANAESLAAEKAMGMT